MSLCRGRAGGSKTKLAVCNYTVIFVNLFVIERSYVVYVRGVFVEARRMKCGRWTYIVIDTNLGGAE